MDTLEVAVEALVGAKRAEEKAKQARLLCEEAVAEMLSATCPEEGSKSTPVGEYKVTIKRAFRYDADFAAMRQTGVSGLVLPIRMKEELDERGYRWLRDNDPATFEKLATCVTRKPAKTGVSVERKEKL